MKYPEYITSNTWRSGAARLGELAAAGFRCRVCDRSKVEAQLEVHHRTYARLGAEDVGDLTTLCTECHRVVTDMLRRRRYVARPPTSSDYSPSIENPTPLRDPTR